MRDISTILTLHFILGSSDSDVRGVVNDDIYAECRKAFDANRGRFEWEYEAVKSVLEKYGIGGEYGEVY